MRGFFSSRRQRSPVHAIPHAHSIRGGGRDGARAPRPGQLASAQEHTHFSHARYHHYSNYGESRQIVVHPQPVQAQRYAGGPVGAVGSVVGGTGQAVGAVFYGAGGIVGGIVGGVVGGVSALFGGPGYSYAPATGYGGPFAAPFNVVGRSCRRRPSRWSAAPLAGRRLPAPLTNRYRQRAHSIAFCPRAR